MSKLAIDLLIIGLSPLLCNILIALKLTSIVCLCIAKLKSIKVSMDDGFALCLIRNFEIDFGNAIALKVGLQIHLSWHLLGSKAGSRYRSVFESTCNLISVSECRYERWKKKELLRWKLSFGCVFQALFRGLWPPSRVTDQCNLKS